MEHNNCRQHRYLLVLVVLVAMAWTAAGCGGCDEGGLTTGGVNNDVTDTGAIGDANSGGGDDACSGASCQSPTDTGGQLDTDVEVDTGPACLLENVCGTACCTTDELCLQSRCVTPGEACEHNVQCPDGHMCEVTLGQCIPQPDELCIYRPEGDVFDPVVHVAWSDDEDTPEPAYNQVMMTPSVVDITENGIPDIVFSTFRGSAYNAESVLRAVNGRTFEPVFDLLEPEKRVSGAASLAIGDIDGDGRNEIIAVRPGGQGLIAFDDHTTGWAVKWETEAFGMSWDGAYLADLNGDGRVEVVAANRVYDGETGQLLCINDSAGVSPQNSIVADLNGDGNLEVIAARGAFRFVADGEGNYDCPTYWLYSHAGGMPAVGDFGTFDDGQRLFGQRNGRPEVVTVNTGATDQVQLVNGQTGQRIWSVTLPTTGHPKFTDAQCSSKTGAGPPTVADFNGDGKPNVATAGACYYVVYDTEGELMWKFPVQDFSSRVTGSSVFDFQGDGKAEVVYGDECFLRVLDGSGNGDGTTNELFKVSNTTGTTRELPVIVDVDGDFHADIVVIANNYAGSITTGCTANWEGFVELGGDSRGIRVIKDRENRWVNTRPVWNQHAYSVTNVCDGINDQLCPGTTNKPGAIPSGRVNNWMVSHLNNYRQNVQGEGLFNAPDLLIVAMREICEAEGITLEVVVANQGSRGVLAGMDVALFGEVDGEEVLVTVLQTTGDLLPGGRETLTYHWADAPISRGDGSTLSMRALADNDGEGNGLHNECNEDNNSFALEAQCPCRNNEDCAEAFFCTNEGLCIPIPG